MNDHLETSACNLSELAESGRWREIAEISRRQHQQLSAASAGIGQPDSSVLQRQLQETLNQTNVLLNLARERRAEVTATLRQKRKASAVKAAYGE